MRLSPSSLTGTCRLISNSACEEKRREEIEDWTNEAWVTLGLQR